MWLPCRLCCLPHQQPNGPLELYKPWAKLYTLYTSRGLWCLTVIQGRDIVLGIWKNNNCIDDYAKSYVFFLSFFLPTLSHCACIFLDSPQGPRDKLQLLGFLRKVRYFAYSRACIILSKSFGAITNADSLTVNLLSSWRSCNYTHYIMMPWIHCMTWCNPRPFITRILYNYCIRTLWSWPLNW